MPILEEAVDGWPCEYFGVTARFRSLRVVVKKICSHLLLKAPYAALGRDVPAVMCQLRGCHNVLGAKFDVLCWLDRELALPLHDN